MGMNVHALSLVFGVFNTGLHRVQPRTVFCKDYKMHINSDSQGGMHSSYNTKNA